MSSSLLELCEKEEWTFIIESMEDLIHDWNFEERNADNNTPIHICCAKGSLKVLQHLQQAKNSNAYCSGINCDPCDDIQGVCRCPDGQYGVVGSCEDCSLNCLTCVTAATTCTSCNSGDFLTSSNTCDTCDMNCNTCSGDATTCTSCSSPNPFLDIDDTCKECNLCDPSCFTCNGSLATNCLSCNPGDYLISSNTCDSCDMNCKTCSGDATTCTSCASPNPFLDFDDTCKECPDGQYDTGSDSCDLCDSSCSTCNEATNNNCLSCISGDFLTVSNTCEPSCPEECPDGQYDTGLDTCDLCDSSCLTCNGVSNNNCLSCFDNFLLENGICIEICVDNTWELDILSTNINNMEENYSINNFNQQVLCLNGTTFDDSCIPYGSFLENIIDIDFIVSASILCSNDCEIV